MNTLDKQYTDLLETILEHGVIKSDRTGTGTKSIFGYTIRHSMQDGFPMLTTKKLPWKLVVTELLWFLRGDTNIKYLVDNGCNIWNGDAYKNYEKAFNAGNAGGFSPMCKGVPEEIISKSEFIEMIKDCDELGCQDFVKTWGELGPIYGAQWRSWRVGEGISTSLTDKDGQPVYIAASRYIDQFQDAVNLLKSDPDSRRNRVSAWNVGELKSVVLPPCHTDFQLYTRELTLKERYELSNTKTKNSISYVEKYTEVQQHDMLDAIIPRRTISLMWNQRSVDSFLGLPFNIASYGLLLSILGEITNMVPDQLIGNLGDTHLYLNHIEQAKEQIGREVTDTEIQEHLQQSGMDALKTAARINYISKLPKRTRQAYPLPKLNISTEFWNPGTDDGCTGMPGSYNPSMQHLIESFEIADFMLNDYKSHPHIPAPLSN